MRKIIAVINYIILVLNSNKKIRNIEKLSNLFSRFRLNTMRYCYSKERILFIRGVGNFKIHISVCLLGRYFCFSVAVSEQEMLRTNGTDVERKRRFQGDARRLYTSMEKWDFGPGQVRAERRSSRKSFSTLVAAQSFSFVYSFPSVPGVIGQRYFFPFSSFAPELVSRPNFRFFFFFLFLSTNRLNVNK